MILGIGIDLCGMKRIGKIYKKFANFPKRILSEQELLDFAKATDKIKFLATSWAAKEAFAKATGAGLARLGFRNIILTRTESGKPQIILSSQSITDKERILQSHITISHDVGIVTACVVIEDI